MVAWTTRTHPWLSMAAKFGHSAELQGSCQLIVCEGPSPFSDEDNNECTINNRDKLINCDVCTGDLSWCLAGLARTRILLDALTSAC